MPVRSTSQYLIPHVSDALFSSLQHLGFQRFFPHARLRSWVQCYWVTQQGQLPSASMSETVYPDGGTTLVFDFVNEHPDITFFTTQHVSKVTFARSVNRMGVRFHPGGAFKLLKLAMPEVIGETLSAADLSLPSLLHLQDQLTLFSNISQRLTLIDRWLLGLAEQTNATTGLIQQLLPQLILTQESLELLSTHLPMSRRQLERKFHLEVGFSPNQLRLLHKVKMARTLISLQPAAALSHIGQEAGFYDQAHFNRHFYKITGQTPGEYRQRKMSQTYKAGNR